jgi:FkbM family methyltransferase
MNRIARPPVDRIEMTCQCRDSDVIPRVANAGAIETFRDQTVQVMHNGLRMVAGGYYGDWMVEVIRRLRGCHEPQEELVFWEVMKRLGAAPVMVELGAFWAYYTCWFLKERPAGRAFCVEPDPNHLAVGRANLELNDTQATFIQAAVDAVATGPAPFPCESDGAVRPTPHVSVDALVREHGVPGIDILLSDAQGAETAMLEGCLQTIRSGKLRFILISTHHHSISGDPLTHHACLARIRDLGGHVFAEHSIAESFSGDGLIAASFAAADRNLPVIPLSYNRAATNIWRDPVLELGELESFRVALRHALRTGRRALVKRVRQWTRSQEPRTTD